MSNKKRLEKDNEIELTTKQLLDPKCYDNYSEDFLFEQAKKLKIKTEFKSKYMEYQKNKFISNNIITMNKIKLNGGEYKISNVDGVECITNFAGQVVTRTLIYPSNIYTNLITGKEDIELTYKKRGEWFSKKVPRNFLSNGSKIEELSTYGISMDMNSKGLLSKFLMDMLDLNIFKIPLKLSIDKLRVV